MSPGDHARSFGAAAERYDRYRPTYPAVAPAWAIGPAPKTDVDLGAGTGLLTRVLVSLGYDVTAVEPDDLMRQRLSTVLPAVTARAGSAESIPLPDASVDAVVCGQAYHWFDRERAHPEIARVLKPGGVFAPMWNERDPGQPWTEDYAVIVDGERGRPNERPDTDFGDLFGPTEAAEFRHEIPMTADDLVAVTTTRSFYLVGTPPEQAHLVQAIRHFTTQHPDLRGRDQFSMSYVTEVFRAYKR